MPVKHEKGYLIPAINTEHTDYVGMAARLAESIKSFHPDAKVAIMTNDTVLDDVFDHVCHLPFGDQDPNGEWRLSNDWQVFRASPFRQTIKLEADMLLTSPFDHWWTLFEHRDVVISRGCRDIYDRQSDSRYYRGIFDHNDLPDVYNAITYWRLSTTAQEFFDLVRKIFEDWEEFKTIIKYPDDRPTTDVVYAIAAVIIGPELVTLPPGFGPSIVHMKKKIIGTRTDDWTNEIVWETDPFRLQTIAQNGMVHYNSKTWKP